jgi:hypothetical protein
MTTETRTALTETLTALHKTNEAILRLTSAIAAEAEEPPKPVITPDNQQYFSIKQAVKYTTLSSPVLRKAIKDRRLAYCRYENSRIIFSKNQLDEYILSMSIPTDRQLRERAIEILNENDNKMRRRNRVKT